MVGRLCIPIQDGEMMVRSSPVVRWSLGVLLAASLAACTSAAQPAATPAATPVPTLAAVTLAPTKEPVRVPISVTVEHRPDGTSVVRDVGNAYQFTLSQEWTVIPVSQEHIDRVAQASPALDAEFLRLAQKLYDTREDAFRLVGLEADSKFAKPENPTLVLVTAIPDRVSATLPMPELARMIQDTVFSSTNAKDMQRDVVQNAHDLGVAVVEGPYDYYSTQGETLKTQSKVLGFQANSRVILIQFITPAEFGAEVLPGIDQIIDTIQRFKP
jgi:hypothetical protein